MSPETAVSAGRTPRALGIKMIVAGIARQRIGPGPRTDCLASLPMIRSSMISYRTTVSTPSFRKNKCADGWQSDDDNRTT